MAVAKTNSAAVPSAEVAADWALARFDEITVRIGELKLAVDKALSLVAEDNLRIQAVADSVAVLVEQGRAVLAVVEEARPLLESPAARLFARQRARTVTRGPAA